jgi:hypothetical protein
MSLFYNKSFVYSAHLYTMNNYRTHIKKIQNEFSLSTHVRIYHRASTIVVVIDVAHGFLHHQNHQNCHRLQCE